MTDSAFSNIVTGTSPAAPAVAPSAPVLAGPTYTGLVAALVVTMPTADVNGTALVNPLTDIKVFFGPTGSDLGVVAPVTFPGSYAPGSQQTVDVTVPAYATAYDFEAEVSD